MNPLPPVARFLPDRYTRVCITPLGVPVAWPDSPAKKPLEDFIAWETL